MKKDGSGIKILCYLGIFVLLIFIVLPPLFRVLFPEEEEVVTPNEEETQTIMRLTCTNEEDFVDYKLNTTINTNYVDDKISTSTFTYQINIVNNALQPEGILIEEYENLKKLDNVDFEEEGTTYTLNINYEQFDYSNEPLLENHRKVIVDQMVIYSDNGFECETTKVQ